ncbi:MAG TPA: FtsX-like permease family protein [Rhodanobacteraceae bacterium]
MLRGLHTCTTLARDNLRGSRGHAAYLIITLAVAAAAWLLLAALAAPFIGGGGGGDGPGVNITNGSQSGGALPLSYARRIGAIPGARNVSWIGLQVVPCGSGGIVTINAVGGPGSAAQLTQQKVSAALVQRWQADPLGAVITKATASKCGWRAGQGVAPKSVLGTGTISMHVVGIAPGSGALAYAHFAYINRIGPMEGKDKVLNFDASAANPRDDNALAARIEAAFAHDFPTVSATTNTTTQNAWVRFGKVQQLLGFVMAALLLCAASVLVSVLAHAAAERKPKFAVLQVLGFQRATLFGASALELLATVVIGALLGIGLAKLIGHELALTFFGQISSGVEIPSWAWWGLPAWLAALFVAALVWPASVIARLRPADYRAA